LTTRNNTNHIMTLKIHGIGASRAVRPLWAAAELELNFEHVAVPYQGGATRTPEFLALNPNGHIPVIEDVRAEGTVTVWESMACALYLARVHGKADGQSITPATAQEEADALRWSFWTVTEVEKDALTVLMHRLAMPADQRKPDLADAAEQRLRVPCRVLEAHLQAQAAVGAAYVAGKRFTIADLCVASVLVWAKTSELLMSEFPTVKLWLEACVSRPAFMASRKLA
jgi:glutathione S-transferase